MSKTQNIEKEKQRNKERKRYRTVSAGVRQDKKHALQPTNITNQAT
jgi:hypothetical protein